MEIDLLYVPDCPNRPLARRHLAAALAQTKRVAVIREREVRSSEEAARLGMRGSPTILISGRDPFAEGTDVEALACRLYRTELGYSGAPTVEQFIEALR
jgi:hypothetical protein